MNMNKEECLKALEKIKNDEYFITEDDEGDLIHIVNLYKNELKTLRCLIEEHFDNPPLKFEELEVGMWVWDNKRKEWCVLASFWKDALNRYYVSGLSDSPFEENRFHRKQVKE